MKLGCHVSISGGFSDCAKRARALGCDAFQFFSKNPRSFKGKAADPVEGAIGIAYCQENGMIALAHSPYITNLSTADAQLHGITVTSLLQDLHNAETYGACGLVVHCGKHMEQGEDEGIRRMVETLNEILDEYAGPVPILLENTAGQGSELGTTLDVLLRTRAGAVHPERIGFCFDTCHAFAAGLYTPTTWAPLAEEMRASGYREHLIAVHLNDSKFPAGTHKDRHENIGKGEIGEECLREILRCGLFDGLPVVLETPVEDEKEYGPELAYTRSLAGL